MATLLYNITFTPTSGSLGTLIEYKETTDTVWHTPSAPANPTTFSTYPLYLEVGKNYNVRVSAVGVNCVKKYIYISVPFGACCPPGYILSEDGTYCYTTNQVAATPPTASETSVAVTDPHFSMCGSRVMNPGYTLNGTGTFTTIPTTVPFWINDGGVCVPGGLTAGPMNRNAVWSTTTLANQTVGFAFCMPIAETKTYYIGMSFDNYGQLSLDGTTIILTDNFSTDPLMNWCIYPLIIPAGNHILEVIGINGSGGFPNPGAIAVEIYDNTRAELLASTGYGDLTVLFKTADYVGQDVQYGSDGIGYTCPPDYALDLCDGPATCLRTLITVPIEC